MHLGNRRVGAAGTRKRSAGHYFQPSGEWLEIRQLLTTELGGNNAAIGQLPAIANVPFGMDFGGANTSPTGGALLQGAGWSVADVGSVNGAPYDDFVIGAPTVGNLGGPPNVLGTGANSAVYLVFGSQTAPSGAVQDWIGKTNNVLNYTPNNRVGDLALTQLGQATQQNPITGTAGGNLTFPFAGLTLFTGSNLSSNLGASVAGLKVNGLGAILIGAPGATDSSGNNPGTGRAYLVWGSGSAWNALIGQSVNLDSATFNATYGLNEIVFVNSSSPGGRLGYSVAGGFNILGDGNFDVILGAPSASVDGQAGTGAVYMASVGSLATNTTIDVATFGQTTNSSVIFAGVNSGDSAGFSVADGGGVNGVTSGGNAVDDLLIGAPQAGSGAGKAYLVYGGSALGGRATTTAGVRFINLNRVGITGTGAVPGAVFNGPTGGQTGFSVASAGNWNASAAGFSDIMIGSPGATIGTNSGAGQVNLFYGDTDKGANALTGTFNLASLPATLPNVVLTGATAGSLAGYSLSPTGIINSGQPNAILIGAPGFNSNAGTAYLIPGRSNFTGTFSLGAAESAPLDGNQYLLTSLSTTTVAPNFFGASVSSRFQGGQQFTADGDSKADFVIGAPGYNVNDSTARTEAGGALIVQGGLITLRIPSAGAITTTIGVGSATGPFVINATTPAALPIFVFGTTSTTPFFMPVTDINPATVVVNGVAFPNATLVQDPNTNNYNPAGIPDAIITISPRSLLGLSPGVTTITISGQTLPTSPLPNMTWTGTATVTVTGGSVTPVVAGVAGLAPGPVRQLFFNGPFGNTQFVPNLSNLSLYNYQPLPIQIALNQFLAAPGFRDRNYSFNHPGKHLNVNFQSRGQPLGRVGGFNQLRSTVFDRGRFHPQKLYAWTHKPNQYGKLFGVVPVQDRTQRYQDNQFTGG
jgi:hypothetical protein